MERQKIARAMGGKSESREWISGRNSDTNIGEHTRKNLNREKHFFGDGGTTARLTRFCFRTPNFICTARGQISSRW